MIKHTKTILTATKEIIKKKNYALSFLPIAIIFFGIFLLIPIVSIPSNTLELQLSLLTNTDYITLSILSLLGSLFILMNVYVYQQKKQYKNKAALLARSGGGSTLGAFASIFGASSCPMCVASLFGFLGFGGVSFLVQYQSWIFFIALFFILISLYFTSKRVSCEKCGEPDSKVINQI